MLTREQLRAVRKIQIRTSHLVDRPVRRPVPQRLQGPRHGVRRGAPVPARRRRAHHRLERDRAHRRAVRQALRRGARAHGDAAGRRQRLDALRQRCGRSSASSPPSSRALLAFSAITNNDKVGLVIFTDRIELAVPPRKGTRHVLRVIREVLSLQPRRARHRHRRRRSSTSSRVTQAALRRLLLSDFLDARAAAGRCASPSRRHDVIAVVLDDPREATLPGRRPGRARGCRDAATRYVVDTGDARVRDAFARARRRRAHRARPHAARLRRRRDQRRAPIGRTPTRCCASSACGSAGSEAARRAGCCSRSLLAAGHVARGATSRRAPVTGARARRCPTRPTDRHALPLRRSRSRRRPGVEVVVDAAGRARSATSRSSTSASTPPRRSATARPSCRAGAGWSAGARASTRSSRPAGALPRARRRAARRRAGRRGRSSVASVLGDGQRRQPTSATSSRPGGGAARLAPVLRRRRRAGGAAALVGARLARAAPAGAPRGAVAAPPRPAHEVARGRARARCAPAGSPSEGAFKEFYSALSDIVRALPRGPLPRARARDDDRGVPGRDGPRRDALAALASRAARRASSASPTW